MKRFRESWEKSREGQGKITAECTWHSSPQVVLFEKPLCFHDGNSHMGSGKSFNTARHCIKKCNLKLYHVKRKAFIHFCRNASEFSGTKVVWDGSKDGGNMFSGQMSSHFSMISGKTDDVTKMKKTIHLLPTKNAKTSLCECMGVHQCTWYGWSAYVMVSLMQRLMLEFWRDILYAAAKTTTFSLFQQDNARPHYAWVTTAWRRRHRVCVLDWPACSPDLSPIENVWHIMKMEVRQVVRGSERKRKADCDREKCVFSRLCAPGSLTFFCLLIAFSPLSFFCTPPPYSHCPSPSIDPLLILSMCHTAGASTGRFSYRYITDKIKPLSPWDLSTWPLALGYDGICIFNTYPDYLNMPLVG